LSGRTATRLPASGAASSSRQYLAPCGEVVPQSPAAARLRASFSPSQNTTSSAASTSGRTAPDPTRYTVGTPGSTAASTSRYAPASTLKTLTALANTEPMTGAQRSYLTTLSEEAKEEFDENLTKAEASKRIEELQQKTGRGAGK